MNKHLIFIPLLLLTLLFQVQAQSPTVGYAYPASIQIGQKTEIILGGQSLRNVQGILCSNPDIRLIKATQVPGFPNPDREQRQFLIKQIRHILDGNTTPLPLPEKTDGWRKSPWYDNVASLSPLELGILTKNLTTRTNQLQASPALRQLVILELDVSPSAKPGKYELRLITANGCTPPVPILINPAPHIKDPLPEPERPRNQGEGPQPVAVELPPPLVLNGQIIAKQHSSYTIKLEKDKTYTFALLGAALRPFIGDAVPGHFQPTLTLFDPQNQICAFADNNYHNPDPTLTFTPKENGSYRIDINDALYRGREDFVFVLNVSEGTPAPLALSYPADMTPPASEPVPYTDKAPPFTLSPSDPPLYIKGILSPRNATQNTTQNTTPSSALAPHTITFTAEKGTPVVIECLARQLGSPLDARLTLLDPKGKVIAENDDTPQSPITHTYIQQTDPYIALTLPDSGTYTLILDSTTHTYIPDNHYILRISPPRPDFIAYTSTSALNIPRDTPIPLTVTVRRLDGFTGDITLSSPDLKLDGETTIPSHKNATTLMVSPFSPLSSPNMRGRNLPPPAEINIYATASLPNPSVPSSASSSTSATSPDSTNSPTSPALETSSAPSDASVATASPLTIKHRVLPADSYEQAFAYYHLIPTSKLIYTPLPPNRSNTPRTRKK